MTNTVTQNALVVQVTQNAHGDGQVTQKQADSLRRRFIQADGRRDEWLKKAAIAAVMVSKLYKDATRALKLVEALKTREEQKMLVDYFHAVSNVRIKFNAKEVKWSCKMVKEGEEAYKPADDVTEEKASETPMTAKEKKKKAEPKPKNGEALVASLENLIKRYQSSTDLNPLYNETIASLERTLEAAKRIQA